MNGVPRLAVCLTAVCLGGAILAGRGDRERAWSPGELEVLATMTPVPPPPPSVSNRYADDPDAAELGRALFLDPRLSADGSVSCASCHDPQRAFTDGRATALGLGEGRRNTPSLLGAAHHAFQMWDGRKDSLWSQALGPIEAPTEMGSHRLAAALFVRDAYGDDYERVFGPLPDVMRDLASTSPGTVVRDWDALAPGARSAAERVFVHVGKALEAFERTLQPAPAPFDRYVAALVAGDPEGGGHLSPEARRGLRAFVGRAGCVHCHGGPLFTDEAFHAVGFPDAEGFFDPGRLRGLEQLARDPFRSDGPASDGVTDDLRYLDPRPDGTQRAFKTPSLRNVARTAPYGHAGRFATLEELVEFYRQPHAEPGLDPILAQVDPDFAVGDMLAFLETLTGALP